MFKSFHSEDSVARQMGDLTLLETHPSPTASRTGSILLLHHCSSESMLSISGEAQSHRLSTPVTLPLRTRFYFYFLYFILFFFVGGGAELKTSNYQEQANFI